MYISRHSLLFSAATFIALFASILSAQTNISPASLDTLMRLFDKSGIKYDKAAMESGIIESALTSVDRRARLAGKDISGVAEEKSLDSVSNFVGNTGYLLVNGFYTNDSATVLNALRGAVATNSSLIIDLRAAGGNDYDIAGAAADCLNSVTGMTYTVEDLKGNIITSHVNCMSSNRMQTGDLTVVLITDNSTSDASELFTALVKGKKGIIIAGDATRGDAYIRKWMPLDAEHMVYLPYARTRVAGCDYAGKGVRPDIVFAEETGIHLEGREPERGLVRRYTSDFAKKQKEEEALLSDDRMLRRAIDIIHGIKAVHDPAVKAKDSSDEKNPDK